MSLGGGTFSTENKVLPGAYINFISTKRGSYAIGERGVGAICMELQWGSSDIIVVDRDEINKNCKELFGYDYNDDLMVYIREFFKHGRKLIVVKMNENGVKASCDFADARYEGYRGNDITIEIAFDIDNTSMYNFNTYLKGELMDSQTVSNLKNLKDNEYVVWKNKNADIVTGIYKLSGGNSGSVTGERVSKMLDILNNYKFNVLTAITDETDIQNIMIEYTKRMREEMGVKFQYVTYGVQPDYEGVVSVFNYSTSDEFNCSLSAWICGALAGCELNESLTNMKYDGEMRISHLSIYSQVENTIKNGKFCFHMVDGDIRVLKDINSLVSFTTEKGEIFSNNQTVRICDQIAEDIANLFINYYLGKVPNDKAGRNSLWSELVEYHKRLQDMRAIEDFDESDIDVSMGDDKTSVVVNESIMPVNSMDKLYMRVYVE